MIKKNLKVVGLRCYEGTNWLKHIDRNKVGKSKFSKKERTIFSLKFQKIRQNGNLTHYTYADLNEMNS